MDSDDRLPERLAGVGCTACGASLASDRIAVLARRDDLAFVEFRCAACGSTSLGLVVVDEEAPASASADVARYGEFGPGDEARLASARPIDEEDVRRMGSFLASYEGDLHELLGGPGSGSSPA